MRTFFPLILSLRSPLYPSEPSIRPIRLQDLVPFIAAVSIPSFLVDLTWRLGPPSPRFHECGTPDFDEVSRNRFERIPRPCLDSSAVLWEASPFRTARLFYLSQSLLPESLPFYVPQILFKKSSPIPCDRGSFLQVKLNSVFLIGSYVFGSSLRDPYGPLDR